MGSLRHWGKITMTDRETLDRARALFTGATQGDTLAREVIAIAESAHKLRLQRDKLWDMLGPLRDAVLYARSQRRPMGIGPDSPRTAATVRLELGFKYGRSRDDAGFWIESDELGPQDADSPDPAKRIALALLRLASEVADKVRK